MKKPNLNRTGKLMNLLAKIVSFNENLLQDLLPPEEDQAAGSKIVRLTLFLNQRQVDASSPYRMPSKILSQRRRERSMNLVKTANHKQSLRQSL